MRGSPGIGEYLTNGPAMPVAGMGDMQPVAAGAPMPRRGRSMMGHIMRGSPLIAGLGDVVDAAVDAKAQEEATGVPSPKTQIAVIALLALAGLTIRGVAGYYVGKALAPEEDEEPIYAWSGAAASVLFGTLGLGAEAAISLHSRK